LDVAALHPMGAKVGQGLKFMK